MNTQEYLDQLRSGIKMNFSDFTNLIDQEYAFENVAFENNGLVNSKDENQGSAKVFCFGFMHSLTKEEAIRCFGEITSLYWMSQIMNYLMSIFETLLRLDGREYQ